MFPCRTKPDPGPIEDRVRVSLSRLQEGRDDQQSTLELEANVEAHPGPSLILFSCCLAIRMILHFQLLRKSIFLFIKPFMCQFAGLERCFREH
jgi:hypothetical protein